MRALVYITAAAALASSLTACVRSSTTMLDQRTAIVSARGTAFDSAAGVTKAVLTEAATLTKSLGYRYFAILDAQDRSRAGSYTSPGQSYTTTNGMVTASGTFQATTTTTTTPGTTTHFIKPGADVTVRMFNAGEIDPNASGIWDADAVLTMAATN